VDKVLLKRRTLIFGLAAWVGLGWLMAIHCLGQEANGQNPNQQSSVTGSIKSGFNKVGDFFTPKPSHKAPPTDDAISLKTPGKPGPELYTAIAKLYEESGKYADADKYYQMALNEKTDDLNAMLGYAKFQENQGRINEAVALYQRAVQTHPKEGAAYNNLGLCFARRGKLNEAASALGQAVQLDPRNPLYRNNLATVLVDQNRLPEAFANLRDVHGEAGAYYNMGYLLNKKGQTEAAEHNFVQALKIDPKMVAAQKWLMYLHDKSRETAMGGPSGDGAIRMGSTTNSSHFPAKVISPPTPNATGPMSYPSQNPMPYPAQNSISAPGPSISAGPSTQVRMPPSTAGFSVVGRSDDTAKAPAQSDAPPLPPIINSPQRLPPISLRQPAASAGTYQGNPNTNNPNSIAPLPPDMR
jgi:Flp pilus assembly protein TadD